MGDSELRQRANHWAQARERVMRLAARQRLNSSGASQHETYAARGLWFSQVVVRLRQNGDVERLIHHKSLEPNVFKLEFLQTFHLLGLHPAELVSLAAVNLLAQGRDAE